MQVKERSRRKEQGAVPGELFVWFCSGVRDWNTVPIQVTFERKFYFEFPRPLIGDFKDEKLDKGE